MTEREKENGRLQDIIWEGWLNTPIGRDIDVEKIANIIQEAGYTKKHFPVEELEAWLNEIKENYEKYNFENIRLFGKNPIQAVLDKIKELEDGT